MDTVTQGLLGAVSAQLGFRQRIGRDATWAAAAVALLPDLDIFVVPLLELTGAEVGDAAISRYHRGLSHSLLMVPVIAAVAAGVWWWLRRRAARRTRRGAAGQGGEGGLPAGPGRGRPPPFALLYACCFVAALTHPLLDWCTSYGTQLLSPITDTRYAIDAVPIIDVIYTPLLILTLLACYLIRKLKPDPRRATLIVGWTGFALSVAYLGAGRAMHDLAARRARQLAAGHQVLAANAYPALGTIFLWRTVVEADDRWLVTRLRPLSRADPATLRQEAAPKVSNGWVRRAWRLPDVQTFQWFAMGQVRASCETLDGRHVVRFHDMRYGGRTESVDGLWSLEVIFAADGSLLGVSRRRHYRRENFGRLLKQAWDDIWSP
ncbi:MAG: hypothetical protein AMJ81_08020 [Phycisphaerae bacterium SM23_33]|jgi:inner membrane protein|nr:MAG: hypothetical protein AMJ81_08020 [Phycisphaerae bacterium SM23_33]